MQISSNALEKIVGFIKIAQWEGDGLNLGISSYDEDNNILLEEDVSASCSGGDANLCNIFIGRRSYIVGGGLLCPNVIIGRYCSISINVCLGAAVPELERLSTSPFPGSPPAVAAAPPFTVIGHDVWIGAGSTVMAGVKIGHGACIGAGSVVSEDVAPYAIMAGRPARLIRSRFPPDVAAGLLKSKWWALPETVISQMPYHDIEACLRFLERCRG